MAKKGSHSSEGGLSQADDFKLIRGIKTGIENRLYKAGITTYAQLSALSPEEIIMAIGKLVGMTTEHVIEQDWIGQAYQLQSKREQAFVEMQSHQTRAEHQHYATFTLELLLGNKNEVRRTRIMHLQGEAEETWAGWEEARVIDFIVNSSKLLLTTSEPVQSGHKSLKSPLPGIPRLEELMAIPISEDNPRHLLSADKPFGVRMILDLSEVSSPMEIPLEYSTTICAKRLGLNERIPIGEAKGSSMLEEKISIGIEKASLQKGVYRLEADIILKMLSEKVTSSSGITARLEGDLIQVY